MKVAKRYETEIAKAVVAHFSERGFEIYQEVSYRGARADIVAISETLSVIVETKTTLGLAVLEQAYSWVQLNASNMVFVATPPSRNHFGKVVARHFGIGVIAVRDESTTESVQPKIMRPNRDRSVRSAIVEAQKTYAEAGNADSRYWSPFRNTCDLIRRAVSSGPKPLKELIDGIDHHYGRDSTARSCIAAWIKKGIIEGVEFEDGHGRLLVVRRKEPRQ